MTQPEIRIDARRPGLAAGKDNRIEALVRVQVPALPDGAKDKRPPLNLAFVIDRSGSMSGRPLVEACRCTLAMLGRLTPQDRAAVIVYDHRPDILVESRPVDDLSAFRQAVRMVLPGGSTNLQGGWDLGRQAIAAHAGTDTLSRVLLLSDGRANVGILEPDAIAAAAGEAAAQGITTSTYGLGDGFNEDLMLAMAKHGGGRAAYGETADDLIEPYQEEFALLDALFGRKVKLRLKAAGGAPVEIAVPKEGIFAMPSGVALVKGGPQPELAAGYINEMIGPEIQAKLSAATYSLPTNKDTPVPAGAPTNATIFGIDWKFVADNRADWVKRWDRDMAM